VSLRASQIELAFGSGPSGTTINQRWRQSWMRVIGTCAPILTPKQNAKLTELMKRFPRSLANPSGGYRAAYSEPIDTCTCAGRACGELKEKSCSHQHTCVHHLHRRAACASLRSHAPQFCHRFCHFRHFRLRACCLGRTRLTTWRHLALPNHGLTGRRFGDSVQTRLPWSRARRAKPSHRLSLQVPGTRGGSWHSATMATWV
jgi:hypothetical protein